ncbi:MAG TPA: HDOD domain-containing protein [Crenotrichaceae bacterium]|nr:HDOD domain-containing protein [Crenotrichaceae bacterium]
MTVNALKKIISRSSGFVDFDSEMKTPLTVAPSGCDISHGDKDSISIDSLKQLIPVRSLSDDELTAFSIGGYAEKFDSNVKLFVENEPLNSVLYLLKGTVRIESNSGRGYEISAGSAQSRFPLSTGDKHTTTATTSTPVTVLRVSQEVLASCQESIDSEIMGEAVEIKVVPPELEDSQLFQALYQNYMQEELALAVLPSVADMVTRAFSRNINKSQAARIVETDPVLTAKLLSVANSPLFHNSGTVYTALDAINVIGMEAARYVIKNACNNYVLKSSNRPYVEQIQKSSAQSLLISGLCFALASLTETVDPKQALTAGLISNIGIMPFSHYVDDFPSQMYSQDEIDRGWPIVRGFMGSFVLEKLGLPQQLSCIPEASSDLMYDSGKEMDLGDIVIISRLLVQMHESDEGSSPEPASIPAVNKLEGSGLTDELTRLLFQIANKRVKMPLAVVSQPLQLPEEITNT